MEDVVSFCDKTIKETNIKINQTEGILNNIYKIMNMRRSKNKSNEASTKKTLHQRKFPKS